MKTWVAISAMVILCVSVSPAAIDRNGNGMSDIWEMVYGASALSPNGDADGDGYSNLEEAIAGTNPFDPNSHPNFHLSFLSPSAVSLNWDSVPGKLYTIQSRSSIFGGSWTNEIQLIAGDTLSQTNLTGSGNARFYRLGVTDVDSDGDGVTDYEERILGFDPTTQHTDRYDTPDYSRITNGLTAASIVTVSALDPLMYQQWPDPGLVAIRRSGGLLPITVNFSLGGTATMGVDYLPSATNAIYIPPGVREVWVQLYPVPTANLQPVETITLTALTGTGYSLGTNILANLTLTAETTNSPPNLKSAARFLIQAAYGPDLAPSNGVPPNIQQVTNLGFSAWIDNQFAQPIGYIQPWVDWATTNADALGLYGNWKEYSWWGRAMGAPLLTPASTTNQPPDPLRQRVAFALSEILVASDFPEQLAVEQPGVANYYDLMLKNAFGNYRNLLHDVALHPVMGIFLSHLGNQKANPANNVFPDENFAREVMQLFSIGLWQLNPNGTQMLDTNGQPIATYNNGDITELARVFTGLTYADNTSFGDYSEDYTVPMKGWDAYHDCNSKLLINGLALPARTPSPGTTGTATLADVDLAISNLFAHPNVGPFIGRQLIQRLVTSNPSSNYVGRVAAAFANNGSGVRGDMQAVVKAILLDPEARDPAMMSQPTWGKLREPLLRVVNFARAFNAASPSGIYPLSQFTLAHGEDPMDSPSVFNFFLPTYSPPGPITDLGLVAPEFQLVNASSAINGPNYFLNAISSDLAPYGTADTNYAVRLNVTNELAMIVPAAQINQDVPAGPAADPDPLLRRLDLALTGCTLSPQEFQIIREAMLRIAPGDWQWHKARLQLAIYLIVTSADFNVLR